MQIHFLGHDFQTKSAKKFYNVAQVKIFNTKSNIMTLLETSNLGLNVAKA